MIHEMTQSKREKHEIGVALEKDSAKIRGEW